MKPKNSIVVPTVVVSYLKLYYLEVNLAVGKKLEEHINTVLIDGPTNQIIQA